MATKKSAIQRLIERTTSSSSAKGKVSGRGLRQTTRPLIIYNLEKGLSKSQLRSRVETMMGRSLTKGEARKLQARRVKSLDEKHKQSRVDRFGRDIRSVRTMEAWRITYS